MRERWPGSIHSRLLLPNSKYLRPLALSPLPSVSGIRVVVFREICVFRVCRRVLAKTSVYLQIAGLCSTRWAGWVVCFGRQTRAANPRIHQIIGTPKFSRRLRAGARPRCGLRKKTSELLLNVDQFVFGISQKSSMFLKIAAFWELGTPKVRKFNVR